MGILEYSAERHLQVIKDEGYALGCRDKENELRPQIDSLTEENVSLAKKNISLNEENVSLNEENVSLTEENVSLTKEKDIAVKENERLKKLLEENGIKL